MVPQAERIEADRANWDFFLQLPDPDRSRLDMSTVKGTQLLQPLFEFSGACAGCSETPYLKLLTQLFGDRMVIVNAAGCSSIYGRNLPTTPYCSNGDGRGPAWANSLFEDNAELGLGLYLAIEQRGRTEEGGESDRSVGSVGLVGSPKHRFDRRENSSTIGKNGAQQSGPINRAWHDYCGSGRAVGERDDPGAVG